jgi:hypothetical protein
VRHGAGATQEDYADKLHELLAKGSTRPLRDLQGHGLYTIYRFCVRLCVGPLSPHHVVEMMCKVDQLIKESGGD